MQARASDTLPAREPAADPKSDETRNEAQPESRPLPAYMAAAAAAAARGPSPGQPAAQPSGDGKPSESSKPAPAFMAAAALAARTASSGVSAATKAPATAQSTKTPVSTPFVAVPAKPVVPTSNPVTSKPPPATTPVFNLPKSFGALPGSKPGPTAPVAVPLKPAVLVAAPSSSPGALTRITIPSKPPISAAQPKLVPGGPLGGLVFGGRGPTNVVLSEFDSDLSLICNDGHTASMLTKDGFAYLWVGARATHGITRSKYGFSVKILENLPVQLEFEAHKPNICRVGWSVADTPVSKLGEVDKSYGWGGTGMKSHRNKFEAYGAPFSVGDTVTCLADLDARTISFCKNGQFLGVAFAGVVGPLFPHILLKNIKCEVNFDAGFMPPGYRHVGTAAPADLMQGPQGPASTRECEVLMLVGLPQCGKTSWAKAKLAREPHKHWNILGTDVNIESMKVENLRREKNYHERWEQLIKLSTGIFNTQLKLAASKRRNYILDQTNVYKTARQRKLQDFANFNKTAAVMCVNEAEHAKRIEKAQKVDGKIVPEQAVWEMKENFVLPSMTERLFSRIDWIELSEPESTALVQKQKMEVAALKGGVKRSLEGPQSTQFPLPGPYPSTRAADQPQLRFPTSQYAEQGFPRSLDPLQRSQDFGSRHPYSDQSQTHAQDSRGPDAQRTQYGRDGDSRNLSGSQQSFSRQDQYDPRSRDAYSRGGEARGAFDSRGNPSTQGREDRARDSHVPSRDQNGVSRDDSCSSYGYQSRPSDSYRPSQSQSHGSARDYAREPRTDSSVGDAYARDAHANPYARESAVRGYSGDSYAAARDTGYRADGYAQVSSRDGYEQYPVVKEESGTSQLRSFASRPATYPEADKRQRVDSQQSTDPLYQSRVSYQEEKVNPYLSAQAPNPYLSDANPYASSYSAKPAPNPYSSDTFATPAASRTTNYGSYQQADYSYSQSTEWKASSAGAPYETSDAYSQASAAYSQQASAGYSQQAPTGYVQPAATGYSQAPVGYAAPSPYPSQGQAQASYAQQPQAPRAQQQTNPQYQATW